MIGETELTAVFASDAGPVKTCSKHETKRHSTSSITAPYAYPSRPTRALAPHTYRLARMRPAGAHGWGVLSLKDLCVQIAQVRLRSQLAGALSKHFGHVECKAIEESLSTGSNMV